MKAEEILLKYLKDGYQLISPKRIDNYIHVSNLIDFCPREYALCIQNNILFNKGKNIPFSRLITFELGRLYEKSIKNVLHNVGILRSFGELRINKPVPVVGNPDAYVELSRAELPYIVEIKTIGSEEFDKMTEPLINASCQLSLYLWMAEKCKLPVKTNEGLIVYATKLERREPIKIFQIERNNKFIRSVSKKLNEVKIFSNTGKLPRRICNSPIALMAKRPCAALHLCFKGGDEE